MLQYLGRRALGIIPVLLVVMTLAFLVIRLIPGDPVRNIIGGQPVSQQVMENLREYFNLDEPMYKQYISFMRNAFVGDFGISYRNRQPVTRVFLQQLPATLQLAAGGILVGVLVGGLLGILSGLFPDSWIDTSFMFVALIGVSMPTFYSAMLLILVFSVILHWIPVVGGGFVGLILPSISSGMWAAGNLARLIRSAILDVMNEDYIRTARAKGLRERHVVLGHATRNAAIPVITLMGLQLALFFGGAAITETVFARQGIGKLLVDSVLEKDYPVVQFGILFTTSAYVFINLAIDVFYAVIDPRIRYD
jgi:ABC-type dipeptide/oligopeptide/nickel transport system permease component